MSENNINLEKKRWYRFLKVVYIFSAIFLVYIAFAWAWTAKPENVVDYAKITCSNGYSVNSDDIDVSVFDETISPSDDEKIRFYCVTDLNKLEGVQKALKLGVSLKAIRERLYPVGTTITNEQFEMEMDLDAGLIGNTNRNYEVEYVYITHGSWTNFLLTFTSISFFGFLFIEIIRRTLLYIIAGKSFFSKNF